MTDVLCTLLLAYQVVLLAYAIFSFVPKPPEPLLPVIRLVGKAVDPLLKPLDRVLPPVQLGGVGFRLGLLVLFFGTSILTQIIC